MITISIIAIILAVIIVILLQHRSPEGNPDVSPGRGCADGMRIELFLHGLQGQTPGLLDDQKVLKFRVQGLG